MLAVALAAWLSSLLLVAVSFHLLRRARVREPAPGEGVTPISVILAARNEAPRIGSFVRSVLGQDHPDFELIVVDDRSLDGTGAAAIQAAVGDTRVTLLRVDARPAGWQGRLHAQGAGAARARGPWLLFLSADQRLSRPTFLRAMVAEYERGAAAAVSVIGPFVGERWWERCWFHPMLGHPVFWGVLLLVQRLRPRARWLIGALGLHRDVYDALGGVRCAGACAAGGYDDWGWARACERHGIATRMVWHDGLHDVSNWTDFAAFWHGLLRWQAGIFTYRRGGWWVAASLAAAVVGLLAAGAAVGVALARGSAPDPASLCIAAIVPTLGAAYCRWTRRPWHEALRFWLVGPLVLASLAGAAWARLRGRVRWRDEVFQIVAPEPSAPGGSSRHATVGAPGPRHPLRPTPRSAGMA
jgi:hypothetical protein